MKHLIHRITIFAITLLLIKENALSQTIDEDRNVECTLRSQFVTLNIDAEIELPTAWSEMPIYMSDYAQAEELDWIAFFWGDASTPVVNRWSGYSEAELIDRLVFYPELEHFYKYGNTSTRYNAYDAHLSIRYRDVEVTNYWNAAKLNTQAEGIVTTPSEAVLITQSWIENFSLSLGWGEFQFEGCYALPGYLDEWPGIDGRDGFYIVEYSHVLSGFPIAYDEYFPDDDSLSVFWSDVVRIWVDDAGIFRVQGYYRSFSQVDSAKLQIGIDEALNILYENMDYTSFSNESNCFDIKEIGLCYRLVQVLPTYSHDVNARLEARPAWRFATGCLRQGSSEGFVMYIDAVTGEVLP